MGVGLGAEIVVGYVTLSEFVPPLQRGRWGSALSAITNSALFVSAFAGLLIIPQFGWRWMFVITGVGALIVWYLRRALPESPRWLESKGHTAEAEKVLTAIEAEVPRRGHCRRPPNSRRRSCRGNRYFFCRNCCQAKSNQSGDRIVQ